MVMMPVVVMLMPVVIRSRMAMRGIGEIDRLAVRGCQVGLPPSGLDTVNVGRKAGLSRDHQFFQCRQPLTVVGTVRVFAGQGWGSLDLP